MKNRNLEHFSFDEVVGEVWGEEAAEVPLHEKVFISVGIMVLLLMAAVSGRVFFIGPWQYDDYVARAESNLKGRQVYYAPRGIIVDRNGVELAENDASYVATLPLQEYVRRENGSQTVWEDIAHILGITIADIKAAVEDGLKAEKNEAVLATDLTEEQIIALRTLPESPVSVDPGLRRHYPFGAALSTVLGYIGRVDAKDLERDPDLRHYTMTGKAGIESFYDERLRGKNGLVLSRRNAQGKKLSDAETIEPVPGEKLQLTIDAELQEYFYNRLQAGLHGLGRKAGVGIAVDPRNGEVLAMVSMPSYDNNVLVSSGNSEEKKTILTSADKPLFNRVVSGFYSPGSTIKPLVALAALVEGVITPDRHIYSPGYLDVPNPYDPVKPSRFLDWRPQGYVNVVSALAQSSNVYFYEVGGGFGDIRGLGISRLLKWWNEAGFGKATGIDLPGEAEGHLPDINENEAIHGRPWLLGDTYNVSIGQGDLLTTPLQLVMYTAAIGNGGHFYRPHLLPESSTLLLSDFTAYQSALEWVQRGMAAAVTEPLGTAHALSDIGVAIGGKTGTAQTKNKAEENAFFIGYAPETNPEIAIVVLVENARQGSLNAVPIAEDVLRWWNENRLKEKISIDND